MFGFGWCRVQGSQHSGFRVQSLGLGVFVGSLLTWLLVAGARLPEKAAPTPSRGPSASKPSALVSWFRVYRLGLEIRGGFRRLSV